jgi:two-component system KDP operon response regulator KdpE
MTTLKVRILVVDDEAQIRKFLRISLEANGYEVVEARTAQQCLDLRAETEPALIILDLGLPDMDGLSVIKRLREWSTTPILVLSVRSDEHEKVRALDAGANDYVTKPAGISELMARIRALLRSRPASEPEPAEYDFGELRMDMAQRQVQLKGRPVHLTRKEYTLLQRLVVNAGKVLTHDELLTEIWGPTYANDTHYLRVLVSALRHKIGDDPGNPRYIRTEPGIGYRFLGDNQ